MRRWLNQQRGLWVGAMRRLGLHPLGSVLNLVVLATAMCLPIGGYLLLANIERLIGEAGAEPEISLMLAPDAGATDRQALEQALRRNPGVGEFRLVTREQALAELQKRSGLTDLMEGLPQNPLPDAYVLRPRSGSAEDIALLAKSLGRLPKVSATVYDAEWAQRLQSGLAAGRFLVLVLGLLLAITMLAITFNTIRMQVLTDRAEMAVAGLLGATPGYLRRPFLYFGALQGALAGLLAWGILALGFSWLRERLTLLLGEFALAGSPVELLWGDGVSILAFSACLGWAGAWLSARRYAEA
ncbi:MAG: ABC transporter permease [Burkholderiales bacterium]|nr:MAG: ABC transporter permease [Burkholderiales bacterium]